MRKTLLLAAVVGMLLGSAAVAQDSVLFFDIRNDVAADQLIESPVYPYIQGGLNGGKAGDAQTLYITPDHAPLGAGGYETGKIGWPNNDGDSNTSTGSLWLYMDVKNAGGGGAGVISSIGLDMAITAPGAARNTLASIAFAWDPAVFTNAGGGLPPFAGKNNGAAVGVTAWNDAKAVEVPVTAVPAFNPTPAGGLYPVNRYRLGELKVVGGLRDCVFGTGHTTNSTYTLKMSVDCLLITRVFNGVPPDTQEDVAFGYDNANPRMPEVPYVNGNDCVTGTSVLPDATIVIAVKGDNTGDGSVQGGDLTGFNAARTASLTFTQTQFQAFINDYTGDRLVQGGDLTGFNASRGLVCPN